MVEYPIVVYQERKYKIYVYVNKINQKKYVGQTCNSLAERAGKNGKFYLKCRLFGYAIQKYGWNSFYPIIILDGLSRNEANIFEKILIKALNTLDSNYGYNISFGGNDNEYQAYDITGQTFGRLTALQLVDTPKRGRYWLCQCECGNTTIVRQDHLRNGTTKACIKCGCATNTVVPNTAINIQNYYIVEMANEYKFQIDDNDYKLIKYKRWSYDTHNNRIVSSDRKSINIMSILFPNIRKSTRYIKYKDNNHLNLRRNNLEVYYPDGVQIKEWEDFLFDNTSDVTFVGVNKIKRWRNNHNKKTYMNYYEAKRGD